MTELQMSIANANCFLTSQLTIAVNLYLGERRGFIDKITWTRVHGSLIDIVKALRFTVRSQF